MAHDKDETPEQGSATRVLARRVSSGLESLGDRAGRMSRSIAAAAFQGRARAAEAADGLRRSTPLRHGLAAAERGNLEAALALLGEAVEQHPEDREAVLALWNVAVATGRAEVAAPAMARWIHAEASADRLHVAVDSWAELFEHAPAERVDAPTLVRLLPELRRRLAEARGDAARTEAERRLRRALSQSVESDARGLTCGLALRVFEQARFVDAGISRRAGELVLSAEDLHETKRRHVEAILAELDDADSSGRPEPTDEVQSDRAAESSETEPAPAPAAGSRMIVEAVPVELSDRSLILRETHSGQRVRLDLRSVAAIVVVQIGEVGAKPSPLIDLVLRRTPRAPSRRIVRIQADSFEPGEVFQEESLGEDPLWSLIGALLDRSGAVPLPNPDSAVGTDLTAFESLAEYEAEVLARLDVEVPVRDGDLPSNDA